MPAQETSFTTLAGVPVHYDRLKAPNNYGSKGVSRTLKCRNRLKATLETCFSDLFKAWNLDKPSLILTAGTIGDGENAHGQGYAFDLDGFYWGKKKFMMLDYPKNRLFYIGINAHLFLHFPQVLSYHYPNHQDHFHVDFNFSQKYRPASNAQTFFVQSCLKYVFDQDLGNTGREKDGVDGIFGTGTKGVLERALEGIGMHDQPITIGSGWKKFLDICRTRAFAQ